MISHKFVKWIVLNHGSDGQHHELLKGTNCAPATISPVEMQARQVRFRQLDPIIMHEYKQIFVETVW